MRKLGVIWAILVLPLAFAMVGCGTTKGKPVKVDGLLTWEDGSPIDGALVQFVSQQKEGGRDASGFTGKDGAFNLTTSNSNDGAMPGDYKIIVTKSAPAESEDAAPVVQGDLTKMWGDKMKKQGMKPKSLSRPKELLPIRYARADTTDLQWKVDKAGEKVVLKLKKS